MKTPVEKIIDFAKANQTLCVNNIKTTKDKVVKKELNVALTVYTNIVVFAKELLAEESELRNKTT